ncbi:MAG: cytochrome c biogenesis heme-transporting ATPase CcmA [Gammaproteobacteria bacterium]|nr:cytochrome c biogenesis heme-transporting ATPase CcmA [Gammaproteobacteria bacterium]
MHDGLAASALEIWRGDRCLATDLSFAASPGSIIRIAGHNGSGKTTLLRALCGLTLTESGKIHWRNQDIFENLDAYHAALAWQGHRDGLKPELDVRENLAVSCGVRGISSDNVDQALGDSGLLDLADLPARSLSAGQKRRVALTRVFMSGLPLWILDEPFANLDQQGQAWGIEKMRGHAAAGGICILSTHLSFDETDVVTVQMGT